MSPEQARDLTDRIKVTVEGAWVLIKQAYESRAWSALGYLSWDDYCTREFGSSRLRLPREERQEVVASLRESGLSLRAIESATGVSRKTVINDLREQQVVEIPPPADDHEPEEEPEQKVIGMDGKSYRAQRERIEEAKQKHPVPPTSNRTPAAARQREERVREMAERGYTSRQIAAELGVSTVSTVADIAKRIGVEIHADKVVGKTRRHDSNRIVTETVIALEAAAMAVELVEADALDLDQVETWASSLSNSLRSLNRLAKQLKEKANVHPEG